MYGNSRGQVLFYTLMIAICVLVLAMAFSPVLKQSTETARNPSNLDCANDSISTFNKVTCIASDVSLPAFIIVMIALAGAIVGAKVVFSE